MCTELDIMHNKQVFSLLLEMVSLFIDKLLETNGLLPKKFIGDAEQELYQKDLHKYMVKASTILILKLLF